eukprot:259222_1
MGNVFDPKRLINKIEETPGKDNLPSSIPNNRIECVLLINGYLRKTITKITTTELLIPMDIINIIGVFHPFINMIEAKAVKICEHTSNSHLFPQPKSYPINKSVKYLMDEYKKLGYIKDTDPHTLIVNFIYHQRNSLDKHVIGAYFSSNKDMIMMKQYLYLFDFTHQKVDICLRRFISGCSLPAQGQIIDKIISLFSEKYYNDYILNNNDDICIDDIYILAYSIIMLNPSLHNPLVRNPMSKERFKKNAEIALASNAAKTMLDGIYDRIKATKIT